MLEVCGDGFGCHTIILYMSDIINMACLKNHFVTNHFNFLLFDLNIDTEKHIVNLMTLTLCFCCVQQAVVFSLTDLGSVTPNACYLRHGARATLRDQIYTLCSILILNNLVDLGNCKYFIMICANYQQNIVN